MFWGLIMEPSKKYSQVVEKAFHISHAALDMENSTYDPVQVLLGFANRNYLICTLEKGKWIQTPLDLNFQAGDKVSFAINGPGHVHLTGYMLPDDEFGDMDTEDQEEEEDEEEEVPQLVPAKKRSAENSVSPAAKKSKTALLLETINSGDDSDDSDDSDVNLSNMLEDDGEEGEEEESGEEEEDDEDEDDSDDEMEDEDSDEVEEKSPKIEKQLKKTPIKENGIAKKQDKTPKQTPAKDNKQKSPQNEKQKGDKTPKGQKTPGKEGSPLKRTMEGGVVIEELRIGDGQVAKPGKLVQVYYEGRLKNNNKMFDSSNKGPGFKFRLGRQEVIKGWDVGVSGMKVGGKRRIMCPPNMAYGAQGSPPTIPPGSTLVFEVELKSVKN